MLLFGCQARLWERSDLWLLLPIMIAILDRRTKEARVDFIESKKRLEKNQHSLELRGVSIHQEEPFLSAPPPSCWPQTNPAMEPGILRGKGPGWYAGGTGELGNKDCTSLSFFSNLLVYSLAETSLWVSPLERKEQQLEENNWYFLKDDEGTQGHKDEVKNVYQCSLSQTHSKTCTTCFHQPKHKIKCISEWL